MNAAPSRLSAFGMICLFSLALFTSAALMFSVQPMIGKMLLPIVGGTPAGWIVAMAFFQLALLAGYTLAYGFSRLPARGHAVAYILTLALGGAFLPVAINAQDATHTLDAGGTFMLLAVTIGAPFIALSTTSTTLQRLFSATDHPAAHDPYFLYAASNLGSFGGLLLYPLLVEPNFTLGQQSDGWFCFYAALVAMAVVCLLSLGQRKAGTPTADEAQTIVAPLPLRRCILWVACAFVPASLLMGYTSFITSDIYSAPMIWVLPLSVYLLTFVLAFRSPALLRARTLTRWHTAAVAVSMLLIVLGPTILRITLQPVIVHLVAFGVIALAFHLRLYEDRPLGSPRQLGAFYLLISLGGALAGIFNAFLAPVIFNTSLELPLVLLLSLFFNAHLRDRLQMADYAVLGFPLMAAALYVLSLDIEKVSSTALLVISALSLLACICHPRVLLIAATAVFAVNLVFGGGDIIARDRNFYGNITVYDRDWPMEDGSISTIRLINHGTTVHGLQEMDGPHQYEPMAYYWSLHELFARKRPRNVMVMGLGTGSMYCFNKPGMQFTFIDVDPAIIKAAQEHFTYLSGCDQGNPARIIQGDGRLELQKLKDEKFDIITIDVFSSEYIPAHIATREALDVYLGHLAPGGIILYHISNNFFDLAPVLAAEAEDAGLKYRLVERMKLGESKLERPSRWLAMTYDDSLFDTMTEFEWKKVSYPGDVRMWTDDYTDYLGVLRKDVFSFRRWMHTKVYQTAKPTPAKQEEPAAGTE